MKNAPKPKTPRTSKSRTSKPEASKPKQRQKIAAAPKSAAGTKSRRPRKPNPVTAKPKAAAVRKNAERVAAGVRRPAATPRKPKPVPSSAVPASAAVTSAAPRRTQLRTAGVHSTIKTSLSLTKRTIEQIRALEPNASISAAVASIVGRLALAAELNDTSPSDSE